MWGRNVNRPLQLLDIVQNKITSTIRHDVPANARDQQLIITDLVLKLPSRGSLWETRGIAISFPSSVKLQLHHKYCQAQVQ